MKKAVAGMIAGVYASVIMLTSANAKELACNEESACKDMAERARATARGYKEDFGCLIKDIVVPEDNRTVYSVTNVDASATIVYSGCSHSLLSVEIKRPSATNEMFRFSRRSGEITRYEVYDQSLSGYELSYSTNGTLRGYTRVANGRYEGKRYSFDSDGRLLETVDVDKQPVFTIRSPHENNEKTSGQKTEESMEALNKF